MHRFQHPLLRLLPLLCLPLFLSACAGLPPLPNLAQLNERLAFWRPVDEMPEVSDLLLLTSPETADHQAALAAIVEEFTQANSTITVTMTTPVDWGAPPAQALEAERPPDVLLLDLATMPDRVAQGQLLPVPDGVADYADLYALLVDAARIDGQLYCVPVSAHVLALLYNRALFDEAGAGYPAPGWTWDDLEAAATLKSDLPTVHFTPYGMALAADASRWLAFLAQAGGALVDETGAIAVESPAAVRALDFYAALLQEGLAVEPAYLESRWPGEVFANGRAGMVVEANWIVPYLAQRAPDLDYAVAPLPAGPGGEGTVAFGACYGVAATSEHPDAAWALVRALTAADAMRALVDVSVATPARISLAGPWIVRYPDFAPFLDGLDDAVIWQLPAGLAPWVELINAEIQAVVDGELTAQEAAAFMAAMGADLQQSEP